MAPWRSNLLAFLVAFSAIAAAPEALAQDHVAGEAPPAIPPAETPGLARRELQAPRVLTTLREESLNPFRQSVFIFDQSMTTQTASLGTLPQSYVPLYEIWLSLRPRYYFDAHWSVRGRFDYTKELTNSQPTTYFREDVFGDLWTDLVYQTTLDPWWPVTKANIGLRAVWPTSKVSQADSNYVTLGVRGGADHRFEIHGEDAPLLNSLRVGLSFLYSHPFSAGTTGTDYGGFAYRRQDVDGFSFISDQLTGATLPEHTFWAIFDAALQITPRFSLTGDFVTIDEWHYAPTGNLKVRLSGGSAPDNQFTESTWLIANADYALFDELDLSIGYYNLANRVAPNGQARSIFGSDTIWWSPDARIFFDLTLNLDVLWDDAHKHARAAQAARTERIANHLR